MIKAILLDVDNTLLDFNECSRQSALLTAKQFDISLPDNFYPVFKSVNDGLWRQIEDGTLTKDELHAIRWNAILSRLGVNFDGIAFEEAFRQNMAFCASPVTGAKDLLEYLYPKYPLFVASNASAWIQESRLKIADFMKYFKHRFLSEKVGVAKPALAFWKHCLDFLKLNPNEVVMVGDSPSADITGAHEAGITTVWYNHDKFETDGVPADYITNQLCEVKKFL